MNFASLKAKAAETAKDARSRASAPSRPSPKYQPVRPEDIAGQPTLTPSQRFAQSTVLQHQQAIHRPPPPPIRSRSGAGETTEEKAAPPAPARKFGAAAAAPPPLPGRTPSYASASSATSSGAPPAPPPRSTPAPPYQHAVTHDLPKPAPPPRSTPAAPSPPPAAPPRQSTPTASWESRAAAGGGGVEYKKFSQYDSGDKEVMFAMLDEFFEARLGGDISRPMPQGFVAVGSTPRVLAPVPKIGESHAPSPSVEEAPPPISLSTRPSLRSPSSTTTTDSSPSYPPPQSHSSSALTLSHYLLHTPFPSPPFYTLPTIPLPPPIQSRTDIRYSASWSQTGSQKSVLGFVLFGDASCCWWRISWDVSRPLGGGAGNEKREVRYCPIPKAWEGDKLWEASEEYGPGIVAFARQAVEGGRPVARGTLNSVAAQLPEKEEPFPSIGRTHGHWVYYCRATADGSAKGTWRGGDVYVRPGDVVEWRKVKIREVGMAEGSYSTLGDPDHTAIILSASSPVTLPSLSHTLLDTSYPLSSLVSLTVAEQSPGQAPRERTYDLTSMSEGEVWIYRPVGLRNYVGTRVEAVWPPPKGASWEVGELE
ncbi:hypothetical protein BCR35DRAFT_306838 [Leucosporidium creatinivorum]|uniref:BBC1/AIM3 cysteine proteinase-fold domain-containing protein n=1 Tax=Leucosporidium creatinivorum TaxID=106004 RepID=A0A1Y2ESB9_9BASI|nr:hypothetical protein BCR35DRAFT_306838 [Leucosporidium creatinivorum]